MADVMADVAPTSADSLDADSDSWLGGPVRRNGHGGRRSLGPRDQVTLRLPVDVGDALREQAEQLGTSLNDLAAALLARDVGLPDLAPLPAAPPSGPAPQQVPTSAA